MKKIIIIIFIIFNVLSTLTVFAAKIAVVNPVEIFNYSDLGSLSIKKIENNFKIEALKLKKEQDDITKQMKILQDNSVTMTKNELEEKKYQIQECQKKITEKLEILKQKEYISKDKFSKKFQDSFDRAIKIIAEQNNYNMVFTTQVLAYVNNIDDISNKVIELMNKDQY